KGLCSLVNKYKQAKGIKLPQTVQLLASLKELSQANSKELNNKQDIIALFWQYNLLAQTNHDEILLGAELVTDLPTYQFNSQKCWIEKDNLKLKNELNLYSKIQTKELPVQSNELTKINIFEDNYTELEYNLAVIFSEVLGITELSIYDDFFKLGGNSLLAVKLITKIRKLVNNIDLNDIIVNNSVHLIFKLISSAPELNPNTIIVPLKENNQQDHIYFIHAVGGSIISYKELANKLPDKYNYYGIQNINIYGEQLLKVSSLEQLAEIYVKEIMNNNPCGKLILGGSSMGGTIAYEMAYQLNNKGMNCEFVFMLDSWATFSNSFRQEKNFIDAMRRQQKSYLEHFKFANLNESEDIITNLIDAQWKLMQLLLNYNPQKSNIQIELFKATILDVNHTTNIDSIDNHWHLYSNNIRSYETIGDHNTIMQGEGLLFILNKLREML
ncbi:MAG: hypothetical protein RLZZ293_418, partial [Pseudomonadota bacterium]